MPFTYGSFINDGLLQPVFLDSHGVLYNLVNSNGYIIMTEKNSTISHALPPCFAEI